MRICDICGLPWTGECDHEYEGPPWRPPIEAVDARDARRERARSEPRDARKRGGS